MIKKPAPSGRTLSIGTKIMLVFFIIFTLLVCTCTYHGFVTEKERITTSYAENIEQTETAVATGITLVSRGIMVLSAVYDPPMADALDRMDAAYRAADGDPAEMDLIALRDSIQENFTSDVHLYIIDATNVIIDTTDAAQAGADFSSYPAFAARLDTIRQGNSYVGDPWEQSVLDPDLVRKYAYLPTTDHRYILEIGLFNPHLADPNIIYFSYDHVTENLETADTAVDSVLVIDANGVIMEKSEDEIDQWYRDHPYISADALSATAARVLSTGDGIEQTFPTEEIILHIFSIRPGFGAPGSAETAYAAIVVYSTEELNDSLEEAFTQYLLVFLGGLIFAGGVGYGVAYTLGRPVDQIAEDVNMIANGDLTHEIRPTNSHELKKIEDSIRILVSRLGDDITQIQAQSEALDTELKEKKRVERRLLDVNRKLSLLSSITRHDVLNQLGVLGMYCDLLSELSEQCPELGGYISRMEETLAKIERQLTFTRDYESMGLEEPRFQDLSGVIQNALISIHAPYIRFSIETDGVEVCADRMLEKVFYNLFENAIRHGGGMLSEIAVTVAAAPGMPAQIVVADNGDGVPAQKKHKIFQQGYGSNTGYGLFLVAEILSITGITIRECGTEGEGARFEIDVPSACWRRRNGA